MEFRDHLEREHCICPVEINKQPQPPKKTNQRLMQRLFVFLEQVQSRVHTELLDLDHQWLQARHAQVQPLQYGAAPPAMRDLSLAVLAAFYRRHLV